ncbi:polynucleotide kinase 3 phosphatase-domain-containing protein [Scheffersomyces amazonensis]|uniref:polynucleotide kinase 3 phosphatase-domain-containing protein n=1 Tax=Scheffersomyces amazonensis TaxID=1078765 RepID=UPI00315D611B
MSSKDIRSILSGGVKKVSGTKSSTVNSLITTKGKLLNDIASEPLWRTHGTYLITNLPPKSSLIKTFGNDTKIKIAAFDLDGTLVQTKSGRSFAISSDDWKWWDSPKAKSSVLEKLDQVIKDKYLIVIFTNQGGVVTNVANKSYNNFVKRVTSVIKSLNAYIKNEEVPILVYASPKKPAKETDSTKHTLMRKPNIGMWKELVEYVGNNQIDEDNSFFVGDAAGRPNDFSDSDLMFAKNIGITNFKTPEEFFL